MSIGKALRDFFESFVFPSKAAITLFGIPKKKEKIKMTKKI